MTNEVKTFCRICEPACGLIAEVSEGVLGKVKPDRTHPITQGYACHKGLYAAHIHRDPDRLNYPQRRAADGSYTRLDWDTATSEIAGKLAAVKATYGANAIAGYLGNPGEYNALLSEAWYGFFNQLGTDRVFNVNTQDCGNKFAASEAVYGSVTIHPLPDFARTELLLVIGENPKVSQMSFASVPDPMATLKTIEARGGRVVFVNPRRIESAKTLGEWLPIKPDTDVYFLASLLCEIERRGGFDEAVLAAHGKQAGALRGFIKRYPAARTAPVTGISTATVEALAQAWCDANGASVHVSTGVNMGRQGTLAYWLVQMLSFATGNLDKPGGNVLSVGFYTRRARAGRGAAPEFAPTPYGDLRKPRLPIFPWPGNLLTDFMADVDIPIRALIVCAGNPVLAMGGEARLRESLPRLELLVVIDLYRNATGEYAHYLLPATDQFEREDINALSTGLQAHPNLQYTPAVVPPRYERRHEREILQALGAALGLVTMPNEDPWGKVRHMLKSRGADFDELKRRGALDFGGHTFGKFYAEQLQTEDGKVDCCPAHFTRAFAALEEQFARLESAGADCLKLINLRTPRMMNSWLANVPELKTKTHASNPLHMNPEDAQRRNVQDGQRVRVQNEFGEIEASVKLDQDLMTGVVAMSHGWGQQQTSGMRIAQQSPGVNCNRLLPVGPGSFDPLSGQAHMTGIEVAINGA